MPKPKEEELDDDAEDLDDEDESEEDDETKDDKSDGKKSKSQTKKLFPQEHVTKVAAREKREGRKAGQRQILAELGFQSLEEAREAIGQLGATDDDEDSSDDDKSSKGDGASQKRANSDRIKLERDREKLRTEKAALARDRHELKIESALLQAGVEGSKAGRAAKLLDVEVGAKPEDIQDAIDELKDEFPELFASKKRSDDEDEEDDDDTGDSTKKPARGNSNPGNRPRKNRPKLSPQEAAAARLKQRHPEFARKD